jgi:DUF2934 family protein
MAKRTTRTKTPDASPRVSETADTYASAANVVPDQADDRGTPVGQAGPVGFDNQAISMASEPSEEEIRMRAYRRYLERGGTDGHDVEDWVEAEKELKQIG